MSDHNPIRVLIFGSPLYNSILTELAKINGVSISAIVTALSSGDLRIRQQFLEVARLGAHKAADIRRNGQISSN
jgi:hypothetical protein